MRKNVGWVGLIGIGVFGVAGCGGNSTVPLDSVGDEFVGALCDQVRHCPDMWGEDLGLVVNLFERGTDGASCEDLLSGIPAFGRTPAEAAGVDAGTIDYDPAQARRCVRAMVADCIPFGRLEAVEECQGIFTGTLEAGADCQATSECQPSTYCALTSSCSGECTAQVGVGQGCLVSDQCRSGSCEFDGLERICVEYTITRGANLGEACGNVDDDGSTRTFAVCADGLYCRETPAGGVCAEPVEAGGDCQTNEVCEVGYFCAGGVCRTVTFADSVGDACGEATYTLCDATQGLACDPDTERCVSVGDGSVGSPCTYEDDEFLSYFACDDGLYCNNQADVPVCARRLEVGEGCDFDGQCETGYCVSGECSEPTLCEAFEL